MTAEAEALRAQRDAAELGRKVHPREVLAVRVEGEEQDIRGLLISLLKVTWDCTSDGWDAAAYDALTEAGMMQVGDFETGNRLITEAIDALGRG